MKGSGPLMCDADLVGVAARAVWGAARASTRARSGRNMRMAGMLPRPRPPPASGSESRSELQAHPDPGPERWLEQRRLEVARVHADLVPGVVLGEVMGLVELD